MDGFLNAVRGQAGLVAGGYAQLRCGVVQSFNQDTYCATVMLQPENVLSGWLPVSTAWSGAGWGLVAPISPGQQVIILAQEGQAEHGIILGSLFSLANRPPATPVGELWLVHQSGSYLKLHNDGTIEGNATTWKLTGTVTISGDLVVGGDIADKAGAHGSLETFRAIFDEHIHPGIQPGSGNTGLAIPQIE
ncbi:phage baseplate assembly protein V [Acidisoma sp. C75]